MTERMNDNISSANGLRQIATTVSDGGSNFSPLNHSVQDSLSEALISASESSEKFSSSSYDRSSSRGRRRKRKTTENSTSSRTGFKRSKPFYNDDYRRLFNSTVKEIASNKSLSSETEDPLQESQIGITLWSSEEKGAFFRALASRGRQDVRGIASDIGSKSESEVHVYSDMLYKAAVEEQINGNRKSLPDTSKLEATLEVRGDCCAALDLAAEALSAFQQNEEEKAEKKRHKDLALLTPRIARWVERCITVAGGGQEEVSRQLPAADLLNLMNFLALSKRFFMNSVIAEDNWRSYIGRKNKTPSMMYTAFSDFHALSISITHRLVQSSLFFAMSRLRAMSASGRYLPRAHVRRRDVIAALNVLGMKTDAKAFWARAARKCKLRVYDKVRHRQVFGKRYSYVEVERILCSSMVSDPDSPEKMAHDAKTSTSRKGRTLKESSASASEASGSSDATPFGSDGSSALSIDEEPSVRPLSPTEKQDHRQEDRDHLQDAYMEALDEQASRNEESRLWEMLGEDPAKKMEPVNGKQPKGSFPTRRVKEELFDWRAWVDYAGDWETLGSPVPGSILANNRGSKQEVYSAAGLTSSESSSGSCVKDGSTEEEHELDSDEDPNGNSTTNDDGASTTSADSAKHRTKGNSGDPSRELRSSSLDVGTPAIKKGRDDLRPEEDSTWHNSLTRSIYATSNNIGSSDDDLQ